MVANNSKFTKKGNQFATSRPDYSTRTVGKFGALQKQSVGLEGGVFELVKELLIRAELLMNNSISEAYGRRLEKAQGVFVGFACELGLPPYLALEELLVAFLHG
ncbi:5615_t:CDS:1 [Dentiscutata erythropus]|uniref:5615_t:CDS:1 n=1 Tax=Dentiscutata erythropus TaxID=1348616 RepID=A0A9N9ADZ7_9GLOM|nr:5615_t:CDS:1 [Dentiscutata erythropus]